MGKEHALSVTRKGDHVGPLDQSIAKSEAISGTRPDEIELAIAATSEEYKNYIKLYLALSIIMVFIMNVMYPQGAKFDMDYYLKTHMPLVGKTWFPQGLQSWKVVENNDPSAKYCVQAVLEWESRESHDKAVAKESGKQVLADIPNFSDKGPDLLKGEVVGVDRP